MKTHFDPGRMGVRDNLVDSGKTITAICLTDCASQKLRWLLLIPIRCRHRKPETEHSVRARVSRHRTPSLEEQPAGGQTKAFQFVYHSV